MASLPSEDTEQRQARTRKDKALVASIIALLTAGAEDYTFWMGLRASLIAWGLAVDIAQWLGDIASAQTSTPDFGIGPIGKMQELEARQALAWRALYILGAAERLRDAEDLAHAQDTETGYFARHIAAEERRARAAALVDVTARLLDDRAEEQGQIPLLSWHAVVDAKTTPSCAWANGKNYRADRIPVIGIPGAVHPRCRCASGPPIPGAALIPSV